MGGEGGKREKNKNWVMSQGRELSEYVTREITRILLITGKQSYGFSESVNTLGFTRQSQGQFFTKGQRGNSTSNTGGNFEET